MALTVSMKVERTYSSKLLNKLPDPMLSLLSVSTGGGYLSREGFQGRPLINNEFSSIYTNHISGDPLSFQVA